MSDDIVVNMNFTLGEDQTVADIVTRLRQKYGGQLPICAEAADEIERLRKQVEDCENDFDILSQIFNKVRAERDQMRDTHES